MALGPFFIEAAVEIVEIDITEGFAAMLTPDGDSPFTIGLGDSGLVPSATVAASDDVIAVPWAYTCKHTGTFVGIPATQVTLSLVGVTFVHVAVEMAPQEWQFHRFIDYIGALHQMGVSAVARPALNPDQYEAWSAAQ